MKKLILLMVLALLYALVCSGCRTQPIIMEKASAGDHFASDETEEKNGDQNAGKSGSNNADHSGGQIAAGNRELREANTFAKPQIAVFVCGAVNDPGVYYLPEGSRCNDAVNAADGFAKDAATDWINLAREVTDGEKLIVPTIEEASEMTREGTAVATGEVVQGANVPADQGAGEANGLINLNTASKEQLMTLSGIGEAIIQYRQEHGGFKATEEIQQVSGIGDAIFEKIRNLITV